MIYAAIKGGQGRERRGAKRPPPILSLMFFRICIQTGSLLPTSKKGPANCFASSKEITKQIVLNFRLSQLSTCIFRPKYFAFLALDLLNSSPVLLLMSFSVRRSFKMSRIVFPLPSSSSSFVHWTWWPVIEERKDLGLVENNNSKKWAVTSRFDDRKGGIYPRQSV